MSCRAPTSWSRATRSPRSAPNLSAADAQVIDADRRHRHPGLHRHPPPHLGDVDPDVRAGLRADHVLRLDPRQVRAALPARRRPRGEPLGRARVHQRGHHDARRLVAHHEHAGPRRRRDPGPPGHRAPVGLRLRLRQHVARRLVVRTGLPGQRPDLGRPGRPAPPEAVLQLRRRPDHDGPRDPRPELLQAGGRAARLGAREGARPEHHRPRRDGPVRLHEDADRRPPGHGPAATRTRPTSTPRTSPTRSGRSSATRAATCRSSPQIETQMGHGWAPGGDRARAQHPDRALVGRRDHRVGRPVHPDARDLRARSAAASTRRRGTPTSTGSSRRRA